MPDSAVAGNAPAFPENADEVGALRRSVGAAIEALVDLLDSLDADPDLDPDSDGEPTLGWREGRRNQAACPTVADEAETGAWLEGPNQQHIGRLGRQHEDEEATALERHGTGFIATGLDDSEDSDPGGGDILDEPHDYAGNGDGVLADPDAHEQFRDELAFQSWMDKTRRMRFEAHEATRAQIMKVTGRKPDSHWGIASWP